MVAAKRREIRFPGGWLVPLDRVQEYIADYIRDKPSDGDKYRLQWLIKHDVFKRKSPKKKQQAPAGAATPAAPASVADPAPAAPADLGRAVNRFVEHLPRKPWCTDDLVTGIRVRPLHTALQKAYIQPNGPGMLWGLVFDIDRPVDADCWEKPGLPPPNLVSKTPETGRGHLVYQLAAGVCTTAAGREHPIRYAAAIERAFTEALGADRGYAGLICKNPTHVRWETQEHASEPYTLGALALTVDLSKSSKSELPEDVYGLGRNVHLFHATRVWAYKAIKEYWRPGGLDAWNGAVVGHVESLNRRFPKPLPFSEVRAIGKSIARWTWRHITPHGLAGLIARTHTPDLQSARGKKATNQVEAGRMASNQVEAGRMASNQSEIAFFGGKASGKARRASREQQRATARLLHARGYTQAQIVAEMSLPKQTISRWLAGG